MQSISSLLKKYKITIKEFAVLYVQIVGKAYQDNVNQISDTYYKRIESLLKQQSPKPAKKSTKSSSVEKSPKKSEKSAFSPAKNYLRIQKFYSSKFCKNYPSSRFAG